MRPDTSVPTTLIIIISSSPHHPSPFLLFSFSFPVSILPSPAPAPFFLLLLLFLPLRPFFLLISFSLAFLQHHLWVKGTIQLAYVALCMRADSQCPACPGPTSPQYRGPELTSTQHALSPANHACVHCSASITHTSQILKSSPGRGSPPWRHCGGGHRRWGQGMHSKPLLKI